MPSIEPIDNLPQPIPHDRVNASGKSNEEKDREAFKQALKRRMERLERGGDSDDTDPLIVDVDLAKQDEDSDTNSETDKNSQNQEQAEERAAETGDKEQSPLPPTHVDLKA